MLRWIVPCSIILSGFLALTLAQPTPPTKEKATEGYIIIRAILGGKKKAAQNPNQPGGTEQPEQPEQPQQPQQPEEKGPSPGGGRGGPIGGGGSPVGPEEGGSLPGSSGAVPELDSNMLVVQAAVEVRGVTKTFATVAPGSFAIRHKYNGVTSLYTDGKTVQFFVIPGRVSPATMYRLRYAQLQKNPNRNPELMVTEAEWCLNHGLVPQFEQIMDMFVAEDAKVPGRGSQATKKALEAYKKVREEMKVPLTKKDDVLRWQQDLGLREAEGDRYSVLYNATLSDETLVKEKKRLLEQHFKAVYYWFVLRGVALPQPQQKLVAAVIEDPVKFYQAHFGYDGNPLVCDGFYTPRENVLFMSSRRLDLESQAFSGLVKSVTTDSLFGWTKEEALKGLAPLGKPIAAKTKKAQPDQVARAETLVLLDRALEEEADMATITHEGSRQILANARVLPAGVVIPRWIDFGTAALFDTPKGPFRDATPSARTAYWFGSVGGPSWAYLKPFQVAVKSKNIEQSVDALRLVVTDGYFYMARTPQESYQDVQHRARYMSWSLNYYISQRFAPEMLAYLGELANLPRDLELDEATRLRIFAQAFRLTDETQEKIDNKKFKEFAESWFRFMESPRPPSVDLNLEEKVSAQNTNAGGPPPTMFKPESLGPWGQLLFPPRPRQTRPMQPGQPNEEPEQSERRP